MLDVLMSIYKFFLKFDFKNNLQLPTSTSGDKVPELILDYNKF
jgi:hypothetical protein